MSQKKRMVVELEEVYIDILDELCTKHHRTRRQQIEKMIVDASNKTKEP